MSVNGSQSASNINSVNSVLLDQLSSNLITVNNEESIPKWAAVLIDRFQALLTEIKSIGHLVNRVNDLETFKAVNEQTTTVLKNEIMNLKARLDDHEQRGRNMCLLVHGVEETDDENTDDIVINIIKCNLEIELSKDDIVRSHRLGPPKKLHRQTRFGINRTFSRPIIFRVAQWRTRSDILKRNDC